MIYISIVVTLNTKTVSDRKLSRLRTWLALLACTLILIKSKGNNNET